MIAVDDVSIEVADGDFLVLVGPSGCGKSTLLRMIAGLEDVTRGWVLIGGRDVTYAAPRSRDVAMVFQSYALHPHMTVRQNLAYGLKVRRTQRPEIDRRVAVMRDGRVQQLDPPQVLYRSPVNLFVAAFIGSPAMNLVDAVLADGAVEFGGHRIPLARGRRPRADAGRIVVGIRPEAFEDAAFAAPGLPRLDVEVAVLEELGSDLHAIFAVDVPPVSTDDVREAADSDDSLLVADRTLFNARVDLRSAARPGNRLQLAVDPAHLHFFDRETGANVTDSIPAPEPAATLG